MFDFRFSDFFYYIKISENYITFDFYKIICFFSFISKNYTLTSMILSFIKFGIISFWVWNSYFQNGIFGQENFGKLHNYFWV